MERASSPRHTMRRRASGMRRAGARSRGLKGHVGPVASAVQPGRLTHRHGFARQDRANLGRCDLPPNCDAGRAQQGGDIGCVQPRRQMDRDGVVGQDRADLGRIRRTSGRNSQGPRRARYGGVLQRRRCPDPDRVGGPDGPNLGPGEPARDRNFEGARRRPDLRRLSRTANGSSRRRRTRPRGFGTWARSRRATFSLSPAHGFRTRAWTVSSVIARSSSTGRSALRGRLRPTHRGRHTAVRARQDGQGRTRA